MKQRTVQDHENTTWQCVQALSGLSGKSSEEVKERLEDEDGKIPVVCTPSGGAQTVRLQLDPDWEEKLSDDELISAIEKAARTEERAA